MTAAMNGANPLNPLISGNLPSVSTEPLKTTTPQETPKAPIPPKEFEGKTVFEAISMQAKADGTIKEGDTPKITKLIGHFPKEGENIIADHYTEGNKKYFKFDVTWKATVNDKSVEFTQVIYTSIEIPADDSKLQKASKDAYEVAKSYELLQRNLKQTGSSPELRAIQTNALISFEKKTPNLDMNNYKASYIPKTSSENLSVELLQLDKTPKVYRDKVERVFAYRLHKMQAQNIILLTEGSGSDKAECNRRDEGFSSKVSDKIYQTHLDDKSQELKKQNKAALALNNNVSKSDANELQQMTREVNRLTKEKPGDLALIEGKKQEIAKKLDETPEIEVLQAAKSRTDKFIKVVENATKGSKDVDPELEKMKADSKKLGEKIQNMKKDLLEKPIVDDEEKIELTVEDDPKLNEADESSDVELLDSDDEFSDPIKVPELIKEPNVKLDPPSQWKSDAKELIAKHEEILKSPEYVKLSNQLEELRKKEESNELTTETEIKNLENEWTSVLNQMTTKTSESLKNLGQTVQKVLDLEDGKVDQEIKDLKEKINKFRGL